MACELIVVYGISNCDTVKKARAWLAAEALDSRFHDFRRDGLTPAMLSGWIAAIGWELLLNRKGSTWRSLGDHERALVAEAGGAAQLLLVHPTLIKRPVVEWPDGLTVGFDASAWARKSSGSSPPA